MMTMFKSLYQKMTNAFQQKRFRTLIYLGILALSGSFIAFITYRNWNQLTSQHWQFDYRYLLFSVLIFSIAMLPSTAGWHSLIRAMGYPLSYRTNLHHYSISAIPRHVPGMVLYLTNRSMLYEEDGVPPMVTLAASAGEIILSGATGFITAMLLFALGLEQLSEYSGVRIAAIVSVIVLILLLFFTPWLNHLVQKVFEHWNIQIRQINNHDLLIALGWYLLAWIGGGFFLFILTRSIIPVEWNILPVMIGIWGAAGAVSLTIGAIIQGLGIREVTMAGLLTLVVPEIAAVVIAVGFRLVFTLSEVLWALIFVVITRQKDASGAPAPSHPPETPPQA